MATSTLRPREPKASAHQGDVAILLRGLPLTWTREVCLVGERGVTKLGADCHQCCDCVTVPASCVNRTRL